ncbi:thioredoxin [Halomicroarcula sp. GCM10025324]|uniref:thioredoxin n=1 Tax=Haloarcula TaxID=2237 RepID=UPI0023E7AB37|nr:thioredoxin [Halomicroarcula sp. ZS-22-S1]
MSNEETLDDIRERKRQELQNDSNSESESAIPSEPIHIGSSDELADAVASYDIVLTDFYADWCGPCKMLEPTVAEIAAETDVTVAKVDVDANQQLAAQYGVRGVPTLVLFADGEQVEQVVGVKGKDALLSLIQRYQ